MLQYFWIMYRKLILQFDFRELSLSDWFWFCMPYEKEKGAQTQKTLAFPANAVNIKTVYECCCCWSKAVLWPKLGVWRKGLPLTILLVSAPRTLRMWLWKKHVCKNADMQPIDSHIALCVPTLWNSPVMTSSIAEICMCSQKVKTIEHVT
jgi:hypothetical protein